MELIPFSGSITGTDNPSASTSPGTHWIRTANRSHRCLVSTAGGGRGYQGRYCHQSWFRVPSQEDRTLVAQALGRVGLLELIDRPLSQLSGGQRKRVFVARGIAQNRAVAAGRAVCRGRCKIRSNYHPAAPPSCRRGTHAAVSIHDIHSARENFQDCLVINKTITLPRSCVRCFEKHRTSPAWD